METYLKTKEPLLTVKDQTPSISSFPRFPAAYHNLVADTLTTAELYNIKIRCCAMCTREQIKYSGYFCAGNKELALSNNYSDIPTLMRTFLRGSCHVDQWLEDKKLWN